MPLVIGLVGEMGSDKGASADMLVSFGKEAETSLVKMRFSDVLH